MLAWKHKISALSDPTKGYRLMKVLKTLHKLNPKKEKVRPIGLELLHKCSGRVSSLGLSPYLETLLRAILFLGYYGCLRVGEMVHSSHGNHCLQHKDTGFSRGGVYRFTLNSFKHSLAPKTLLLSRADNWDLCPIRVLAEYYLVRPSIDGPLFVFQDGRVATRAFVAKHLKDLVTRLGMDPKLYNTHSLRVGRASDLALAGASPSVIKDTGRWNSDAYLNYVRFNLFHLPTPGVDLV